MLPFCKRYMGYIFVAFLAITLTAASTLLLGVGLRKIVDNGLLTQFNLIITYMGVIVLVLGTATYLRYTFVSWLAEKIIGDVRKKIYAHLLSLSPGFFERLSTGELLSRMNVDTTLLQALVSTSIPIAIRNFMLIIGGVLLMFKTSMYLSVLMLSIIPVLLTVVYYMGQRIRRLTTNTQRVVAELSSYSEETLNAVRTVQAFCHEEEDKKAYNERVQSLVAAAYKRIKARAIMSTMVVFLVFGSITLIVHLGVGQVAGKFITLGELTSFLFYGLNVGWSISNFIEVFSDVQKAAGASQRIFELLEVRSSVKLREDPVKIPKPSDGEILFDQVSFSYSEFSDAQALIDFSMHVKPGQKVALVGPSGSGKTTVFHLLMRFYDPTVGNIYYDTLDLKDLSPTDIRSQMAIVPQEPVVFSASAYDNIRYGSPNANFDAVRAAAEAALVTEFVDRLPKGYYSYLGSRGVTLSTGQRQRIAIARALLKNPRVLLLDEATSALDAQSERLVQKALEALMEDRTTLMIAHRLSTVLKADYIIVLNHGRIEAIGTHDELMRQKGLYKRLANLQYLSAN